MGLQDRLANNRQQTLHGYVPGEHRACDSRDRCGDCGTPLTDQCPPTCFWERLSTEKLDASPLRKRRRTLARP